MTLGQRIAHHRKALGISQETLGERLGVSRQAVSKWESGQTVPDAITVAKLCRALNVSADYIILGKEPEEGELGSAPAELPYKPPQECPVCKRAVEGNICPGCGYPMPTQPPRGPSYALVTEGVFGTVENDRRAKELMQYCGFSQGYADTCCKQMSEYGTYTLLRRGLSDTAVQWLASHLDQDLFRLKIVEDCGESDDMLVIKRRAMELPAVKPNKEPMSFSGTVLAVAVGVILALLLLSVF